MVDIKEEQMKQLVRGWQLWKYYLVIVYSF